jgi:general secretion pathway protein G
MRNIPMMTAQPRGAAGGPGDYRPDTAKAQMKKFENALELYYLDAGRYRSSEQGLEILVNKPENGTNWKGPISRIPALSSNPGGHPTNTRARLRTNRF